MRFPSSDIDIFQALTSRRSVRAFLPRPVDRQIAEFIWD
jgi:nitroreductase